MTGGTVGDVVRFNATLRSERPSRKQRDLEQSLNSLDVSVRPSGGLPKWGLVPLPATS